MWRWKKNFESAVPYLPHDIIWFNSDTTYIGRSILRALGLIVSITLFKQTVSNGYRLKIWLSYVICSSVCELKKKIICYFIIFIWSLSFDITYKSDGLYW